MLKQILLSYELASGQCINFQKCAVSFSPNIRRDIQDHLATFLGVTHVDVQDRYLGLPFVLGRKRFERFFHIKDCLWKKLKGWKEKLLSTMGKDSNKGGWPVSTHIFDELFSPSKNLL